MQPSEMTGALAIKAIGSPARGPRSGVPPHCAPRDDFIDEEPIVEQVQGNEIPRDVAFR